jgi:hypothetical protein
MTKEKSAKGSGAKRKQFGDEERKVRRKVTEPEWATKMAESIEGLSKKMAEDEEGQIEWEEGLEKKVDAMGKSVRAIRNFLEGTGAGLEELNRVVNELVTKVDGLVAKVTEGSDRGDGDDGTESGEKSDEDQVEETLGTQVTQEKTTGAKDVQMGEPGPPAS